MTNENISDDLTVVLYQIEYLLHYAEHKGLIECDDLHYSRNQLLQLFQLNAPLHVILDVSVYDINEVMEKLINYGYHIELIVQNTKHYRDLLEAKIMGLLLPRPSQFIANFNQIRHSQSVEAATDYFYQFSIDSRYIRMDRIQKNESWTFEDKLQLTINLAKPEKDPAEIARLKTMPKLDYPLCLLCKENEGYSGRDDFPARQNLRIVPIELNNEAWFLQYSPYVYYREHSIVVSKKHTDMTISECTFKRLIDFLYQFPHYFVGSNADLPIVGGSILNHEHFQAGRHHFPMQSAKVLDTFKMCLFPQIEGKLLDWPLSVIRLQSEVEAQLIAAASYILQVWREYTDETMDILAYSINSEGKKVPHNTITPVARINEKGQYEFDLILRNNRTTADQPYGIFHPHKHLHHIKKENIGLIEAMGLAILPARLQQELKQITSLIFEQDEKLMEQTKQSHHPLHKHTEWITYLYASYSNVKHRDELEKLIKYEVGNKFSEVLQYAGVFKQKPHNIKGFHRFIDKVKSYT